MHVVGLSILSDSHVPLVRDITEQIRAAGLGAIPVVVGGIITAEDEAVLKAFGVAAIYTPKNFKLNEIMSGIVQLAGAEAKAVSPSSLGERAGVRGTFTPTISFIR